MITATILDKNDILDLIKVGGGNIALRLHWESDNSEPIKTTPLLILDTIKDEAKRTNQSEEKVWDFVYAITEIDYQIIQHAIHG